MSACRFSTTPRHGIKCYSKLSDWSTNLEDGCVFPCMHINRLIDKYQKLFLLLTSLISFNSSLTSFDIVWYGVSHLFAVEWQTFWTSHYLGILLCINFGTSIITINLLHKPFCYFVPFMQPTELWGQFISFQHNFIHIFKIFKIFVGFAEKEIYFSMFLPCYMSALSISIAYVWS